MSLINLFKQKLTKHNNLGLIWSLIFCLSLTASLTHYLFVIITKENIYWTFDQQQRLFFTPHADGRLLSSLAVNAFHFVLRKFFVDLGFFQIFMSLILTEFVFAFFAYGLMFLVAQRIIKDERFSLFSIFIMAVFTPIAYQLASYRYGELLSVGFYMAFIWLVFNRKEVLFFVLLFFASLQRPEMAISAVFFKGLSDYFLSKRNIPKMIYNASLVVIPFMVLMLINKIYGISTTQYVQTFIFKQIIASLKGILLYWPVFAPILFLTIFNYKTFGKEVYLMLIALIPYLIVITCTGNYSETRLFLPIVAVLIIGILNSIKNKGAFTLEKLLS